MSLVGRPIGSVFGMTVRTADSRAEWDRYVAACRAAGGVDIGEATRTDYDIVIDEAHGIVLVNPSKEFEVMQRFMDLPEFGELAPASTVRFGIRGGRTASCSVWRTAREKGGTWSVRS
jgi:hypothetical protein